MGPLRWFGWGRLQRLADAGSEQAVDGLDNITGLLGEGNTQGSSGHIGAGLWRAEQARVGADLAAAFAPSYEVEEAVLPATFTLYMVFSLE